MTQLSVREKIGYSLGDTATNLTWRSFMVFLPIFYTDVFGLSAAAMGTLLLVCRFWDGITDFIMGIVADRTKTRWGKFRPWILWTAFPFGLLTVLAFTTPDFSYTGKLIYAYVTYSLLIIVFTANNVPYSALMGVMTSDPIERTSLSSYRFVFAYLGALMVQGGLIYLVAFFGRGNEIEGYMRTMILFAIILVAFLLITFFFTKERVKPMQGQSSIRQDFKDLVNNKPWLTLFFIGIIFVAFTSIKQGGVMFYFTHYLGAKGLAAGYMVLGLVGSLIGAAITKYLVVRTGKRVLFILAAFISGVFSIPLFFLS
ncbi:MFS transporter, partial [candidate division KSB1 bacterium]|nr:MFS transporter [candidate division KSB1 bacterium]